MGKQVHYVVCVDLEAQTWWVDDETFSSRFYGGEGTWNTITEEWEETNWDDNLAALGILNSRTGETTECPKHEGAFDCTPFCELCNGQQEITKGKDNA